MTVIFLIRKMLIYKTCQPVTGQPEIGEVTGFYIHVLMYAQLLWFRCDLVKISGIPSRII